VPRSIAAKAGGRPRRADAGPERPAAELIGRVKSLAITIYIGKVLGGRASTICSAGMNNDMNKWRGRKNLADLASTQAQC
jgi:hypothetical protein